MSVAIMAKVWATDLPTNEKIVLLAYADHADDEGASIYPGELRMADKTSYSTGNIRKITAKLVEGGLLHRVERGRRGTRAVFLINVEALDRIVGKARNMRAYRDGEGAHQGAAIDELGAHHGSERRAPGIGKARTGDTPNHHEPSLTISKKVESADSTTKPTRRDRLWEAVVDIHGEPATKTERGKLNRAVGDLRHAKVTADEYPTLVAAFVTKHSQPNRAPLQPTAMTIATRIGELRHFLTRGPITSPAGTLDQLAAEQQRRRDLTALEAAYGVDGKQTPPRMEDTA